MTYDNWKTTNRDDEQMTTKRKLKMRHCFNCGAELGVSADHDPLDTCGKQDCDRAAMDCMEQERSEAHEQLDRDRGW
jgi:hypothetical protein